MSALILALALAAGLGDGFAADGAASRTSTRSVTYPRVSVQVGGYVSITPTIAGITPGTYSVVAGALPDGLALNSSTGAITGSVTTTALLAGAGSTKGRHVVQITAGDGASTKGVAIIDVYAIDIPNPESLLSFRAAQQSGSNFIDDVKVGTTWTLKSGVVDSDLTDATSPLGYAFGFAGTQYYRDDSGTLTKPSPVHATVAALLGPTSDPGTAFTIGNGAASFTGFTLLVPSTPEVNAGTGGASTSTLLTAAWQVSIGVADSGHSRTIHNAPVEGGFAETSTSSSSTYSMGTNLPQVCSLSSSADCGTRISQVGYWPRSIDAAQRASSSWCMLRGVSLEDCDGTDAPSGNDVTIDLTEPTYERPVTCTGEYTLTGTATGATSVTWRAEPNGGDPVACTGTSSWSCAVTISPDAAGEGVETISITASSTSGKAIARQDVGFYVTGAHDCFLSQDVDGDGNATLVDNDLVSTWVNLANANRSLTASSTARPSFQVGVGSGVYVQPLVQFDGNDLIVDNVAADWNWMHNGTVTTTFETVVKPAAATDLQAVFSTTAGTSSCGQNTFVGVCLRTNLLSSDFAEYIIKNASGDALSLSTTSHLVDGKYQLIQLTNSLTTGTAYIDGTSRGSGAIGTVTTNDASSPFRIGGGNAVHYLTGPVFRVVLYQDDLDSTQRAINKAVDEWALGNSLPVNP